MTLEALSKCTHCSAPAFSFIHSSPKGQLNSEWIFEVIISPEMQIKNYKDFRLTKQTKIVAKKSPPKKY